MKKAFSIMFAIPVLLATCTQKVPANGNPGNTYPTGDLAYTPEKVREVLDRQQKAAFTYFYDGAEPQSGLAFEGNNRENNVTIGGAGFGVMALVVGVERGWITREQGTERMRKILDFLKSADRYKGVWSHWHHPDGSYAAFGDQKATGDLVETSYMIEGLIVAREYFDRSNEVETTIREDIDMLYSTVDWAGYTGTSGDGLYWLWYSAEDKYSLKISGWNEGLASYLLALGADDAHTITPELYEKGWNVPCYPDRKVNGYLFPLGNAENGGPLFFSHYSFLGFDPRKMEDSKAWYWKQNQSHTMLNRHYCLYEAPQANGYGPGLWGLTACYGAGSTPSYSARSPKNDDGVIAPTAALSSFPYTPFYSAQVLMTLDKTEACQGEYGFADSYKPSEGASNRNHLAIDQGPIVVMIENYRSGLIWDLFMKNEHVKKALRRAGIGEPELKEGFPFIVADSHTGLVDLMAHPDREKYEIEFSSASSGKAIFKVMRGSTMEVLQEYELEVGKGVSVFSFDDTKITRGKKHYISMTLPSGKSYQIETILH
ncbi:MAG: glucoamylase family protein [Candidatus Cryptobacteroides sp.]